MARSQLGQKYVTADAIENWKKENGYDKPLFVNHQESGFSSLTQTIFFEKSLKLFAFDFCANRRVEETSRPMSIKGCGPAWYHYPLCSRNLGEHLCGTAGGDVPGHRPGQGAVILFVILMSISYLFYIIGGQYLVSKLWRLVPISGYTPSFLRLEISDTSRRCRCCFQVSEPGRVGTERSFLKSLTRTMCEPHRPKG